MVNDNAGGSSAADCKARCAAHAECQFWDWGWGTCRLRSDDGGGAVDDAPMAGGSKWCLFSNEPRFAYGFLNVLAAQYSRTADHADPAKQCTRRSPQTASSWLTLTKEDAAANADAADATGRTVDKAEGRAAPLLFEHCQLEHATFGLSSADGSAQQLRDRIAQQTTAMAKSLETMQGGPRERWLGLHIESLAFRAVGPQLIGALLRQIVQECEDELRMGSSTNTTDFVDALAQRA